MGDTSPDTFGSNEYVVKEVVDKLQWVFSTLVKEYVHFTDCG
jgi:hypothetical protein